MDRNRATGMICRVHFDSRNATREQVAECASCQAARKAEADRIQLTCTIDPAQPYGQHISLTCKNHPDLRWSTKNIDYIGARGIFYFGTAPECACPASDLVACKGKQDSAR